MVQRVIDNEAEAGRKVMNANENMTSYWLENVSERTIKFFSENL